MSPLKTPRNIWTEYLNAEQTAAAVMRSEGVLTEVSAMALGWRGVFVWMPRSMFHEHLRGTRV